MDILITGYKGFIGKYITEMLAAQGHQLFLYDIADGFDLTDKKIIDSLPQTGFVVHLANLSFVPKSYEQPHLFYETNVMSTLNLPRLRHHYSTKNKKLPFAVKLQNKSVK